MKNPIILNWYLGNADYSEDGTFATLTFKVLDEAEAGDAEIKVTYDEDDVYNISDKNVMVVTANGTVKVTDYLPGVEE